MISRLDIENYRAIRSLSVELAPLSVVTGPNGAGKSTLYRALELIRAAAIGDLSLQLAREGGFGSAQWAGAGWTDAESRETAARPRANAKKPFRMRFAAALDHLEYALELGAPRPTDAALSLDPVVKYERLRATSGKRPVTMAERNGPALSARDADGRMAVVAKDLWLFEPALSALAEPQRYPEFDRVRRGLAAMRFYSQFRVDPASPLRQPAHAIFTPSVSSDGEDWAAALASLAVIESHGDGPAARAVAEAFPGGAFEIAVDQGTASVALASPEFPRAFSAREMSDGTLRFLVWVAALTAVRPPSFMALNEPESSLHPNLITPLADLIGRAAERTQVLVVTHSEALADRLDLEYGAQRIRLRKDRGETVVV